MGEALNYIKARKTTTDKPRLRIYVVAYYSGAMSIGWPGAWKLYKIDLAETKAVVELLRKWGWEEHRLTRAVEFAEPLVDCGFDDENAYLIWTLRITCGCDIIVTPLGEVAREDRSECEPGTDPSGDAGAGIRTAPDDGGVLQNNP
jgi:hypothetical protein